MTNLSPLGQAGAPLPLITFKIGSPNDQPFFSLRELTWQDVPGFAILTGPNGSGKTQLLELLAYGLGDSPHPYHGRIQTTISVDGDDFGWNDVVYLSSAWTIGGSATVGLRELEDAKQNAAGLAANNPNQIDISQRFRSGLVRRALAPHMSDIARRGVDLALIPDDFAFLTGGSDVISQLAFVFVGYRLRWLDELARTNDVSKATASAGPAPWNVLNEILAVADFPYRVNSPEEIKPSSRYELRFVDQRTQKQLRPWELSSGEAALMAIVGWLYSARRHDVFPKLLILDEPDARLHPSMTRIFLDVVNEILVGRYRVRVLMSTHSPSTVAMAPEGSVFEMSRQAPRVRKSQSRETAVALLTAGLVTVTASTRYVFVEDSSDAEFYGVIRNILTDYGPGRDACALPVSPSIVFLSVAAGAGPTKVSGGKSQVENWVAKFDGSSLASSFLGLIDRDAGNSPRERVSIIARYSIENYLLDPLIMYGSLLDLGVAPVCRALAYESGRSTRSGCKRLEFFN